MSYQSFEDLDVWKKACQIAVELYLELKNCKDFSFRDQMNRAGISIASNISEGAERGSNKDFIRFLHISKASAAELRTQLYIADRVGLVSSEKRIRFCEELIAISRMLHALIKSLKPKT
jgi:four helix bundle protein